MNLLICSESHFVQVGRDVYCPLLSPDYFQRYRAVWDEVVVLGRLSTKAQSPLGAPRLDLDGIRLVGLPDYTGPLQYLRYRRSILNIVRGILPTVDSIIMRGGHQISQVVYSLLRGSGRPYGIEVVGDPYDSLARGSTPNPLWSLLRRRFVRILQRLCRDAYASAYVTTAALQRRYPPGRGKFTTHYSDVVIKPVAAARRLLPANGPFRLVAIGTLATRYKAHDILLKAVAIAVQQGLDVQLAVIGDGQHLPEMRQLAVDLGIDQRVEFLGQLPFGEPILAELDRAHLLVMPSRQEGLPRALVEAMARALPCVGTNVGGIPELLRPEELVPPNDPGALAAKLLEVLSDGERMRMLSQLNLEVAGQFTERSLRDRRLEFYEQLRVGTAQWLQTQQSSTPLSGVSSGCASGN